MAVEKDPGLESTRDGREGSAPSEDAVRTSALLALDALGVDGLEAASDEQLALVESVLEGLGGSGADEIHSILEEDLDDARTAHDQWRQDAAHEALETMGPASG